MDRIELFSLLTLTFYFQHTHYQVSLLSLLYHYSTLLNDEYKGFMEGMNLSIAKSSHTHAGEILQANDTR